MAKAKQKQVFESVFNTYSLESVIGEGGAGRVWRAADSTGQRVAVKVLSVERATTERRKRFQNEIVFCERAKHPNIVEIIDRGLAQTDSGATPFYVMPILDGSLRTCLANTGDIAKRLLYFDQLLSGVEAAHLQRVIHRDLKPENVLYNKANDIVVVADFGIAHFTDEELYTAVETAPNARLANFAYSAPEQRIRGRATDARTDIYALGLMLNEIFTGEVPFGTGFKTVASVAPDYEWIDDIVNEMIQWDPEKRPSSIDLVKSHFLARRQDFVTKQRLSQIRSAVVPVGEEDDPLALDPPRVVDFDWDRGKLTLILDRPVNDGWVSAIRGMGDHTALWNKGPETFSFDRDRASVSARESEVQPVIDYFKQWLPRATQVYRERRERQRREAAERERSILRAEQEELERRQRIRERIRL